MSLFIFSSHGNLHEPISQFSAEHNPYIDLYNPLDVDEPFISRLNDSDSNHHEKLTQPKLMRILKDLIARVDWSLLKTIPQETLTELEFRDTQACSMKELPTPRGLLITANSGISANATSIINLQGGNTSISGTVLINPSPSTTAITATGTIGTTSLQLNATGSGSITHRAAPTTTSYTLTWPNARATNSGQALTSDANGNLSWTSIVVPSNVILNGGNSFGTDITIGTNDGFATSLRTSGADRLIIGASGDVAITNNLDIQNSNGSVGVITKSGRRFILNPGDGNTFVGVNAGTLDTKEANNNTGMGLEVLNNLTTGTNNVAVGNTALTRLSIGNNNTAIGWGALAIESEGGSNTAVGSSALAASSGQNANTAIGESSLIQLSKGSNNVALGYLSGRALTQENNNIIIGANVDGTPGVDGRIQIGNQRSISSCFISGIRDVTTEVRDAIPVLIDSEGQLGTISSSARYKDNIRDLDPSIPSKVLKLRPVQFTYKNDITNTIEWGLIAEEVEQHLPELTIRSKSGALETVRYHVLPTLLLQVIKQQDITIKELAQRVAALEQRSV